MQKLKIKNYFLIGSSGDYVPEDCTGIFEESFKHAKKKLSELIDTCYSPSLGIGSRYIIRGSSLGFYVEGGVAFIDRRGLGEAIYLMNENSSGIEKMAFYLGLDSVDHLASTKSKSNK